MAAQSLQIDQFSPLSFSKPLSRSHCYSVLKFKNPCLRLPLNSKKLLCSLTSSSTTKTLTDNNNPQTPAEFRVDILSESLPFIQKFRGKTIVVKYGGAAMKPNQKDDLLSSVVKDLVLLSVVGLRPVLVHGGGPEINFWLKRFGIEPIFRDGLRVTDANTMEIVSMVLIGKVNKSLVSLINKAGATAVGLSGMDGRLFTARPSPNSAKLGFVGEVARVDPTVIEPLVNNGHIPVVASVAADEFGQSYNINADTVAGELAAALGAEKLILLTDVAGILENREDPTSLVKEIDIKGVKRMIENGKVGGGMIPKVNCCIRSLAQGVRTASIIDGRVAHSLLLEIMTDAGAGKPEQLSAHFDCFVKGQEFFERLWAGIQESLNVMLVCGSDLLQSFAIPGFWISEQVRTICRDYGVVCIRREGQDVEKTINDNEILNENKGNIKLVDELVPNQISSTRIR